MTGGQEGARGAADRPVLLRGGRVVDPSQGLDAVGDVLLVGGRVERAAAASSGRWPASR